MSPKLDAVIDLYRKRTARCDFTADLYHIIKYIRVLQRAEGTG